MSAIPLAERYVVLAHQKHGEENTEYGTAISWLAELYRAQGLYPEAEPLFKRSLAIREKALGPDHPDVGQSLSNLAMLALSQGDLTNAASFWRQATAVPSAPRSARDGRRVPWISEGRGAAIKLGVRGSR